MPLRKRNTTCRNIWYCQKSNGVLRGGGAGLRRAEGGRRPPPCARPKYYKIVKKWPENASGG